MRNRIVFGERPSDGRISGKVLTKGNNAIFGVPVYAKTVVDGHDYYYIDTTDNTGAFDMRNVYYGVGTANYFISPNNEGHHYSPDYISRSLDVSTPTSTGLIFKDTTSFEVAGKVTMVGSNCALEDCIVKLDGKPTIFRTDQNGEFRAIVEEPGKYQLSIQHKSGQRSFDFVPTTISINVDQNLDNLYFMATTSDTLSISALSGCGKAIADSVLVRIERLVNDQKCFSKTVMLYATEGGEKEVILPCADYQVEVVNIWPYNSNILNGFEIRQIDLVNPDSSHRVDFVHRGKLVMSFSQLPEAICLDTDSSYILQQGKPHNLAVHVDESHNYYKSHHCPVDTGVVAVLDDISEQDDELSFSISGGIGFYTLEPQLPNLLPSGSKPYQKRTSFSFSPIDSKNAQKASKTLWAFIEGHKPRKQTFVTKTPELPFFILHDPPGSNSYSYMEEESSFSQEISQSIGIGTEVGGFLNASIGFGIPVPFTGKEVGSAVHVNFALDGGTSTERASVLTTTTIQNNSFSTSSSPDYVGTDADIVVGASMNMIYALTDVLSYDEASCSAKRDTSLVWGEDGLATTYSYTIGHIRDVIIPDLKALKLLSNPDSAIILQTYIDVWEQVIEQNQKAIDEAALIENPKFLKRYRN